MMIYSRFAPFIYYSGPINAYKLKRDDISRSEIAEHILYNQSHMIRSACVALYYMCVYVIFDHGITADKFLYKCKFGVGNERV